MSQELILVGNPLVDEASKSGDYREQVLLFAHFPFLVRFATSTILKGSGWCFVQCRSCHDVGPNVSACSQNSESRGVIVRLARGQVAGRMPWLKKLDGAPVTDDERAAGQEKLGG
mmetsp:Transcript_64818/g.173995  ORF Transcript_64818/g.173995 Transcript_64818/m.173995 type:complete len:115 (+) Transcript_64818:697-1041(+)